MHYILDDIKNTIDYKLITSIKHFYRHILFKIVELIYDKLTYSNFDYAETAVSEFTKKIKISNHTFNEYFNWLNSNEIIWRSKLAYSENNKRNKNFLIYNTYKYAIHKNIEIKSLKYFCFNSNISNNKKLIMDKNLTKLYDVLSKTEIDWESALETVYNSSKSHISKQLLAKQIYKLACKDYSISYGENVKRVFF